MRDWYKLEGRKVREDNALFQEFRNDFLITFGKNVKANCGLCWLDYFYKMTKFQTKKMETKTEYKLRAKYNGTQFNGKIIRQGDLTDAIAKKLIKEHPAGVKLFDFIPVKVEKATPKVEKKTTTKAKK